MRKTFSQQIVWYIFLLPTLLGILLFLAYPALESFRISFFRSDGFSESFVGIDNYKYILNDDLFWTSVGNTVYIGFFTLLISIPLGFTIGSIINNLTTFQTFFKVIFFIPYMTSIVAAAMIFLYILNPEIGLLNALMDTLGLPRSTWLSDPTTARMSVVILSVWHQIGFITIITIANLQAISKDIYESSSIDGATSFQQWLYITIPNMRGTFIFFIIMGSINSMKRFSETYVLGGETGSPGQSLHTVVAYIYNRAFNGISEFGASSAAAYILFALILIITLINLKVTKSKEDN